MWVLIIALCKPSFGTPGHVTRMLQAENWQKVDDLEPIYLGKYRFWWKMICAFEHTVNCLSFGYVRLPQPEHFFSFLSSFLLFFLFLLRLSTFKLLNALYSKFKRLKMSRRTSAGMKSGVPGWGDLLQSCPPKFWTFKSLELDSSKFRNG